jgi:hypothetical protein
VPLTSDNFGAFDRIPLSGLSLWGKCLKEKISKIFRNSLTFPFLLRMFEGYLIGTYVNCEVRIANYEFETGKMRRIHEKINEY